MKKLNTKLHLLELEVLADVISISDIYDTDDYFDDEDFKNTYKDFMFVRCMSFLYEYITENSESVNDFDYISNDKIIEYIDKLQNYDINDTFKNECIDELQYIINNR